MIIFFKLRLMPKCKYCGMKMNYWVIGLLDKDHAHPGCAGNAMADESFKKVMEKFKLLDGE